MPYSVHDDHQCVKSDHLSGVYPVLMRLLRVRFDVLPLTVVGFAGLMDFVLFLPYVIYLRGVGFVRKRSLWIFMLIIAVRSATIGTLLPPILQ